MLQESDQALQTSASMNAYVEVTLLQELEVF